MTWVCISGRTGRNAISSPLQFSLDPIPVLMGIARAIGRIELVLGFEIDLNNGMDTVQSMRSNWSLGFLTPPDWVPSWN